MDVYISTKNYTTWYNIFRKIGLPAYFLRFSKIQNIEIRCIVQKRVFLENLAIIQGIPKNHYYSLSLGT